MRVTLDMGKEKIHFISVYAPDASKSKEEIDSFYEQLQIEVDKIPKEHKILIMDDLNATIGDAVIDGIKQRYNEPCINTLVELCAQNEFRINNTYFDHKAQHKIIWANSRRQTSMIDYIISNRAVHPSQILDIRSLTSAKIESDHHLVLGKMRLSIQLKRRPKPYKEKLNIELLKDETIRYLYKTRLEQKIRDNGVLNDDVETSWKKAEKQIKEAANEVLESRKVNKNSNKNNTPWFTIEVKQLAKEKRKAYIQYLNDRTPEELQKYTQIRNRIKSEIRRIKEEYSASFTVDMEHDMYDAQKKVWSMIRRGRREVNKYVQTQTITREAWTDYFRQLYDEEKQQQDTENRPPTTVTTTHVTP